MAPLKPLIFVLLATSSAFAAQILSQKSSSSRKDVGRTIQCEGIKCPPETTTCAVKKDAVAGNDQMTVKKICKSREGKVLLEDTSTVPSPNKQMDYHSFSETDTFSNFNVQSNVLSVQDEREISESLVKQAREFEEQSKALGAKLQTDLSETLANLFRRSFPFQ